MCIAASTTRNTDGMTLATRLVGVFGVVSGGIALVGCSAITESAPVQGAKNQAVCAAISQPLQLLQENADKIGTSPAGQAAGGAIESAESALKTATETATGQVATALLGLDGSVTTLINAWASGALQSELAPLISAVKTDAADVQAACAP